MHKLSRFFTAHHIALAACVACISTSIAHAQSTGITTQGSTGGLVIPSAKVLSEGSMAFTLGNYMEPQFNYPKRGNYSLGVGLLPNVEIFGRIADYQDPIPGSIFVNGPRDLSANVKLQLPDFWKDGPTFAIGANDVGGGAQFFQSFYGVMGHHIRQDLDWTLGYAKGKSILGTPAGGRAFNGLFGGAELYFGNTGMSGLAEYDGQTKHLGIRYQSDLLPLLGGSQLSATLQRSLGAHDALGQNTNRTSLAVSLMVPLERNAKKAQQFAPAQRLPAIDAKPSGMVATLADRLEGLQKGLSKAGLERVRVGMQGATVVVEYENNRYAQNEADAVGIVLGLGAEFAPANAQRVQAVTLKAGLRNAATSVDVLAYRSFLRDNQAAPVRSSLTVTRAPVYQDDEVQWHSAAPSERSKVRIELKPEIDYALATEFGLFDYSLALNAQSIIPLWQGAEIYTSYIRQLANTANVEQGRVFQSYRQRDGFKTVALHQSVWLGKAVHANVGVGKYNYDNKGVQGEATVYVPNRDDVVRLRAAQYQRLAGQTSNQTRPMAATYRWVPSPTMWIEGGFQSYSDGGRGPSLALTRWFGDVAAHLVYTRSNVSQFAGLEISIPLTPRRGMEPGLFSFAGTPQFTKGVRTRITDGNTSTNNVDTRSARDFAAGYNAEQRELNLGRQGQAYYSSQIYRMREAFYLYALDTLPQ
jgi:Exopolysaccharide biosynthesis protein YbjH